MEQNVGNTLRKFLLSVFASVLAGFIVYTYQDKVKAGLTCAGQDKLVIKPVEWRPHAVSGDTTVILGQTGILYHTGFIVGPRDLVRGQVISGRPREVDLVVDGKKSQQWKLSADGSWIEIPPTALDGSPHTEGVAKLLADSNCSVRLEVKQKK